VAVAHPRSDGVREGLEHVVAEQFGSSPFHKSSIQRKIDRRLRLLDGPNEAGLEKRQWGGGLLWFHDNF